MFNNAENFNEGITERKKISIQRFDNPSLQCKQSIISNSVNVY